MVIDCFKLSEIICFKKGLKGLSLSHNRISKDNKTKVDRMKFEGCKLKS